VAVIPSKLNSLFTNIYILLQRNLNVNNGPLENVFKLGLAFILI